MRKLRRTQERHAREQAKWHKRIKRRAIAAGTIAAITLGAGAGINKALAEYTPNPHELPVSQDSDGDLLSDPEEAILAYLAFNADQNRNGIPDGVELAKLCATDINNLPWENEAGPNETYKWWNPQYGMHTCSICGATMGMGPGGVVNPRLGISVSFDFLLGLHYMEHGSYSYDGFYYDPNDPIQERIDVPGLLEALERRLSYDPDDHQLPVANDSDSDLLSNKEEFSIGYQPFNDDQNINEIPDGVELAKRCAIVVGELPVGPQPDPKETYKIEHALDGTERCHICGQDIHMGGWEIINPKLNLKYPDPNDPLDGTFLPDLALHYMEHGSFDCYGDLHQGRVNLQRLMRVVELRYSYEPNEHQLPLDYVVDSNQLAPDANDLDEDLMADTEELAAGYNLYDADQDKDLNPDGIELAEQCSRAIDELPIYDPYGGGHEPNEPYKVSYLQHGLERCEICGEAVNMGWWQVVNPNLGLSIDVQDITCHYMSHGSFSYSGTQIDPPYDPFHTGRIDLALLVKILEMPRQCGDLGTLHLPGDFNGDCKEDFTDFAEFANKWLENTEPGQD